ncbi:NAD-dependent epimerase/dehydratase family protein [Paucibacter sp. DJ2R-2]|uniref:NAD-dependent epimerase/dehydratase family protein n=1 Tax=Paucibacter sp. DJ2R-2 TaxID=2893558 RepID=UPI0021E37B51|nr:SDR family oxidoreductase [Paucibacter sp. DJ2R-2]MCV2420505.1 SDR family oxidoreductase [Paucibacter sp. DJ4R-1]MCV2439683.1 SDR family oxidoreductase [Paucibacter sp. DJ2R-2]
MRILITGNMGYIGPVLVRHLRWVLPAAELIAYDSGFFAHVLSAPSALPERQLDAQYFGDVRDLPDALLRGVDAVVALAAVSNDPMGSRFEAVTDAINHRAVADLAGRARAAGVRRFVFASSCSLYGAAEGGPRREGDALNPLTAYARSKLASEQALAALARPGDSFTALRFATACGMSERLRLDLVLNDFVACAVSRGEISVLSDGSPWRPLIEVRDMARAIEWALLRPVDEAQPFLAINTGASDWNYQVRDLAAAVQRALPGTALHINTEAPPDRRSYRVDFSLFQRLAPAHQPQITLDAAIAGLIEGLRAMRFGDADFRSSSFMRLKVLEQHITSGALDESLRWQQTVAAA